LSVVRILVVEDAADLCQELVDYFRVCGFDAHGASHIASMTALLASEHWDVVVLDLGLPDGDGMQVLQALRDQFGLGLGIIVMTARGHVEDRIAGRSLGADNYLVKPVDLRELKAAVEQLIPRLQPGRQQDAGDAWTLHLSARRLQCPGDAIIDLTGAEARLLAALFAVTGDTISRESLCRSIYLASTVSDTRRLDTLVSRLRGKVDQQTGLTLPVSTFRNVGYAFFGDCRQL
jgi:DNA-binding response OmpR family regulator